MLPIPITGQIPILIPSLQPIIQQTAIIQEENEEIINNLEQNSPNNTLYINNLNERVRLEDLKESLQEIFEEYGTIIEIICKKNIKMRGQAFIVFQDVQSSMNAKEAMQGAKVFGKSMRINYSRQKSDIIAKSDGSYTKREKGQQLSLKEQLEKKKEEKKRIEKEKQDQQTNKQPSKQSIQPHNILFIENINNVTHEDLQNLFTQYNGFKEVRLITAKKLAFAEFEDEFKAGMALTALVGTSIKDCPLQISYAKR